MDILIVKELWTILGRQNLGMRWTDEKDSKSRMDAKGKRQRRMV